MNPVWDKFLMNNYYWRQWIGNRANKSDNRQQTQWCKVNLLININNLLKITETTITQMTVIDNNNTTQQQCNVRASASSHRHEGWVENINDTTCIQSMKGTVPSKWVVVLLQLTTFMLVVTIYGSDHVTYQRASCLAQAGSLTGHRASWYCHSKVLLVWKKSQLWPK